MISNRPLPSERTVIGWMMPSWLMTGGELVERFLVERLARLVRVRPDGLHVELGDAAEQADAVLEVVELGAGGVAFARVLAPLRGGGEQRAEAFAERCFLRRHGGRE